MLLGNGQGGGAAGDGWGAGALPLRGGAAREEGYVTMVWDMYAGMGMGEVHKIESPTLLVGEWWYARLPKERYPETIVIREAGR